MNGIYKNVGSVGLAIHRFYYVRDALLFIIEPNLEEDMK